MFPWVCKVALVYSTDSISCAIVYVLNYSSPSLCIKLFFTIIFCVDISFLKHKRRLSVCIAIADLSYHLHFQRKLYSLGLLCSEQRSVVAGESEIQQFNGHFELLLYELWSPYLSNLSYLHAITHNISQVHIFPSWLSLGLLMKIWLYFCAFVLFFLPITIIFPKYFTHYWLL